MFQRTATPALGGELVADGEADQFIEDIAITNGADQGGGGHGAVPVLLTPGAGTPPRPSLLRLRGGLGPARPGRPALTGPAPGRFHQDLLHLSMRPWFLQSWLKFDPR